MTALYFLTEDAWRTRAVKALSEGYFVREHGATVLGDVMPGVPGVVATRDYLAWHVSVSATFDTQGATVTQVRVVAEHPQPLTAGEATILATLVNLAGRSAEFIDRTFKNLRVQNATVVPAEGADLDAVLRATGRPVTTPFPLVKTWGVCPVCGKLLTPHRAVTASGGYREEWVPRYCDHGPFAGFKLGGIGGTLPEVGQPATVQVGSDQYAAKVVKVAAKGNYIVVEREHTQPVKATWRRDLLAYVAVGTRGQFVTVGEATSHRAEEF